MTDPLRGILSALVTPFREDEGVALDAIGPLLDYQVKLGLAGVYVGGSSGEGPLQSMEERQAVLTAVAAQRRPGFALIAHVGSIATAEAITLARAAADSGYDAISAIPPYYYGFLPEEILSHYRAVADASTLPLIIYNFPDRTAGFAFDDLARLFEHPRIAGIKHTSRDMHLLERIRAAFPEKHVFNGYDEMCLAGLTSGATGAIGTTYNFMGDVFVALAEYVRDGRIDEALPLQAMANRVIEVLIAVGVIAGTKAVLTEFGVDCGPARRPFRGLRDDERQRLRAAVEPVLAWRRGGTGAA